MTKYPLHQLQVIKKKKLEEAERILREKKEMLAKEEEILSKLEAERDRVKQHRMEKLQQLREELDKGSTTDKIQQMKNYLKIVDEQLKKEEDKVREQLKKVEAAEQEVDEARANRLKKERDVQKLVEHHQEWKKETRYAAEQAENIEADEMGSARFIRKRRHEHKKKQ